MSRFISASEPAGRWRAAFCVPLCLAFLLALPVYPCGAEQSVRSHIRSVAIEIDGLPGNRSIDDLVTVKAGEAYSLHRINQAVKQIYRTGLFSYVRAEKSGDEQVDLVFHCTSRLLTRRIYVLGNEDLEKARLKNRITAIQESAPYSEEKQERAVIELQRALERSGFFKARVRAYTERVAESNQVDLLFQVKDPRRYRVGNVEFAGDVRIPEDRLRDVMKIRPGKLYVPAVLDADIDRLKGIYSEAGYRRADLRLLPPVLDDEEGTVDLHLQVDPKEKIELVIEGADIPQSLILPIWESPIFEEWGAAEGEAKIVGHLRKKGYLFAAVQTSVQRDENRIQVVHKVAPGQKYRVGELDFRGLTFFSTSQLRKELALRQNLPFLSTMDGARIFELPLEIEYLYKTRGFPETRATLNFEPKGSTVHPIINIEEGRQETVGKLVFQGNRLLLEEKLLAAIESRSDGPYYQPSVQKDIEKLVNLYLDEGVRGTEITAQIENTAENRFDVTFQLEEGRKVRIAKIIVTGNRVTRPGTIDRELRIREGDLARWSAIRESKRRLENLGVFTEIQVEEIALSPESENLLISVREGERNYVGLGLGLETREEPKTFQIWNTVVRPRGTGELIRSNMFGIGAQISLVGQISLKERRGVFSWEQPYFFGLPLPVTLNGWWEREERLSYTYERQGVSLSGIRQLASDQSLALVSTLRYARTKLLTLSIEEDEVDRQFFPYSVTSISGSVIWDKRNDPFNPQSGHFFSSVLEWAYPLFNSESDFLKTFSKFQYYLSPWERILLSATARLGLSRGRIPIHERFFAGGSNSFRGASFDELGPRDSDSLMPVGGKALILFNLEASFPLFSQLPHLFGTVFYDKGNVFSRRRQVSWGGLQDALGVGLRYRTPLGPVRLEVGWNLDAPESEQSTFWFITIGNVF
jgi:outer membrane protein assembly complex protein YaeT